MTFEIIHKMYKGPKIIFHRVAAINSILRLSATQFAATSINYHVHYRNKG
jgi:hypothetical protein